MKHTIFFLVLVAGLFCFKNIQAAPSDKKVPSVTPLKNSKAIDSNAIINSDLIVNLRPEFIEKNYTIHPAECDAHTDLGNIVLSGVGAFFLGDEHGGWIGSLNCPVVHLPQGTRIVGLNAVGDFPENCSGMYVDIYLYCRSLSAPLTLTFGGGTRTRLGPSMDTSEERTPGNPYESVSEEVDHVIGSREYCYLEANPYALTSSACRNGGMYLYYLSVDYR